MSCLKVPLKNGQFITEVTVINPRGITFKTMASYIHKLPPDNILSLPAKTIIDTGSIKTAITEVLAKKLGLRPMGWQNVHTGSHEIECYLYSIIFCIPRKHISWQYVLGLPGMSQNFDMLIGMDFLWRTNFQYRTHSSKESIVSPYGGELTIEI